MNLEELKFLALTLSIVWYFSVMIHYNLKEVEANYDEYW